MKRIVIRPRIQRPVLVLIFTVWALLGLTYFTNGDVVAKRDWFGIALGVMCLVGGAVGVWRSLRIGIVIDAGGVRIRSVDSRQQVIPWRDVRSVECAQIDERVGLPIYGPVIEVSDGLLPLRSLGSYSKAGAERRAADLRRFIAAGADASGGDADAGADASGAVAEARADASGAAAE